jgi:hypothetical protein
LGDIKERNNSWKNKYGYQLGVKYYNAFKVDNLQLQLEYNHVRPYVYSHSIPITNYAQIIKVLNNGAETSKEFIAIARYITKGGFCCKVTAGTRGLILTLLKMI